MSKLERNLVKHISRANRRFSLIEDNDRIMVAVSGGKDSWGLLSLLRAYRKLVPFRFELVAVTLDQGQPGFDGNALEAYYKDQGYEYRVVYRDTYSVVLDKTPEGNHSVPSALVCAVAYCTPKQKVSVPTKSPLAIIAMT